MCTITLEYNQNNALARHKLAALLATGLFVKKQEEDNSPTPQELKEHRELKEAFFRQSRKSMSNTIAKYL